MSEEQGKILAPGGGTKIERENVKNRDLTSYIDSLMMELGKACTPQGLKFSGFALVFLIDKKDDLGNYQAQFLSRARFADDTPEGMADAAMKELSRHTMQVYGRTPPKERTQ